jgi:hypothetical protein
MPRGFKVSCPPIAIMVLFANRGKFLEMNIYIRDDIQSSTLEYLRMIVSCSSLQKEDIFEHPNDNCHVFAF